MTGSSKSIADNYVLATNQHDPAAFFSLFAMEAEVDDNGRKLRGLDEIRAWGDREIFAANVTLEVVNQAENDGESTITTFVDGNFDRTGLPDPVVITHRLELNNGQISRLTCRLA